MTNKTINDKANNIIDSILPSFSQLCPGNPESRHPIGTFLLSFQDRGGKNT